MFRTIKNDLPASIVVFFVALPVCLGIALTSGAPIFSGVIVGIIGGVVIGSLIDSSGRKWPYSSSNRHSINCHRHFRQL